MYTSPNLFALGFGHAENGKLYMTLLDMVIKSLVSELTHIRRNFNLMLNRLHVTWLFYIVFFFREWPQPEIAELVI